MRGGWAFRGAGGAGVVVAAALLLVTCGPKEHLPTGLSDEDGSIHPPPTGGGGGGADGSTTGSEGGGGPCNNVVNAASVVNEQNVPENLPGATGGTLITGLYYLTAVNVYTGINGSTGPTGSTFQETINYDVATYDDARNTGSLDAGSTPDNFVSGTYSTAGNVLTLNPTCPAPGSVTKGYSVIGGTLHTFVGQIEYIYTHQ